MIEDDHPDLARLAQLEAAAAEGGGAKAARRQRRLGRLLARERIEALAEPDSFRELGKLVVGHAGGGLSRAPVRVPGDGVVTGTARVQGRPTALYAYDPTVLRGSLGVSGARKIVRLLELAMDHRLPVIAIHDSDGVRVDEGPEAIAGFAEVLGAHARLSGWVPQISVVTGLCVGGSAYSTALMDLVVAVDEAAFLFVTGSKVTRIVTGQEASIEELGGAEMHARTTGLVAFRHADERECLAFAARALSYLPAHAEAAPERVPTDDPVDRATPEVLRVLPDSERKGYDVRRLLRAVLDRGSFLELQAEWARNVVVGFARLEGRAVGIVASQPSHYAGCLDVDASRKAARLVQLCSAFGLPVITFCDVPGFLPGTRQEQGGLLVHGAKLIAAYAACRSPLISLIVRKSYGGGNVLAFPADLKLAYPFGRVQPMGTSAAMAVTRHRSFGEPGADADADEREELRRAFGARYDAMERAAEAGFVDAIVHPDDSRRALAEALRTLRERPPRRLPPRLHANLPL